MPTALARRKRVAPLYTLIAGTDTLENFLANLTRLAKDQIDRELSCGIITRFEDRRILVASSNDLAERLDEMQNEAGDGPCIHAMTTSRQVEVSDLGEGEQWPTWRALARSLGLRKMLAVPLLSADGTGIGALNLYSTRAEPFTDDDRAIAHDFAHHAAGALVVALRLAEQAELLTQLEAALTSRAVIDQAKGIVMAQRRCDAQEAFDILREASMRNNTKLRDVAAKVVGSVTRKTSPPPPPPQDGRRRSTLSSV